MENKGQRAFELYSRLLEERIIFLGTEINDETAHFAVASMLYLEDKNPTQDIYLYINSPGGFVTASMAIYDTIKRINPDVVTICLGLAAGTASLILAAGAKGKRKAVPDSKIALCEFSGHDYSITPELIQARTSICQIYANLTGQSLEKLEADMANNYSMSALSALGYGFIDHIIERSQLNQRQPDRGRTVLSNHYRQQL